jgi:hypothetical protein
MLVTQLAFSAPPEGAGTAIVFPFAILLMQSNGAGGGCCDSALHVSFWARGGLAGWRCD